MSNPIQSYLDRAQQLLAEPTDATVRYAALELRTAVEALTYRKLSAFASMIPESLLKTWQPHRAIQTLIEFDELADTSYTIEVGDGPWDGGPLPEMHMLGEHKAS